MTDGDLTTAQVAARLHKSPRTVQRMVADGRIKGRKLPGRTSTFLIDETEVDRVLAEAGPGERERAS
jgi:excisionase family DNA binding protein